MQDNYDNRPAVALIAPSSAVTDPAGEQHELNWHKLESVKKIFENQGFKVRYYENIFQPSDLPYIAAPKAERFKQLQYALEDQDIKIIAVLRGGYGAQQIVFDLMNIVPSGPKIFIGFSDATAINLLFNQHYNMASIHGIVSESHASATNKIFSLLKGKDDQHQLIQFNTKSVENTSIVTGITAGGNLAMLVSMLGTDLAPHFTDKIVILEDIGEPGYKIHRMLLQLYNAKIIQTAKAIIFADFDGGDVLVETSIRNFIEEYLPDRLVYRVTGIGHTDWTPFILGANAEIADNVLVIKNPFSTVFDTEINALICK
ncbi:MAG: LD-carboxypeptidase [Rickettsiaceae bacterium]|nr:LD-carboxypeptidase [Rickettsiaceae bacterium]